MNHGGGGAAPPPAGLFDCKQVAKLTVYADITPEGITRRICLTEKETPVDVHQTGS